jgi:hypothetical protein
MICLDQRSAARRHGHAFRPLHGTMQAAAIRDVDASTVEDARRKQLVSIMIT